MAFSASLTPQTSFTTVSQFPQASTPRRSSPLGFLTIVRAQEPPAESAKASTGDEAKVVPKEGTAKPAPSKLPKKPVYSMQKGQIVRVDKEKYLNSVNYLSVGHPPFYKGLDYIYEDRGEILDLRIFETGEYALISWVGVPTAPAWLPTDMLIKSDKLDYERL